jgi:hypothetical protein
VLLEARGDIAIVAQMGNRDDRPGDCSLRVARDLVKELVGGSE